MVIAAGQVSAVLDYIFGTETGLSEGDGEYYFFLSVSVGGWAGRILSIVEIISIAAYGELINLKRTRRRPYAQPSFGTLLVFLLSRPLHLSFTLLSEFSPSFVHRYRTF